MVLFPPPPPRPFPVIFQSRFQLHFSSIYSPFSLLHLPLSVSASFPLPSQSLFFLSQFVPFCLLVPNRSPSEFITFFSHRYLPFYSLGFLPPSPLGLSLPSPTVQWFPSLPFLVSRISSASSPHPCPPSFRLDFPLLSQFFVSCPGVISPTVVLCSFTSR